MKTRVFNIIERASADFGYEYEMEDALVDIFLGAENAIMDGTRYDIIDECERNRHYTHICWSDKKGFVFEEDGEFISSDSLKNTYFRKQDDGKFVEIPWYECDGDSYILMDYVIDTDGRKVALVCK